MTLQAPIAVVLFLAAAVLTLLSRIFPKLSLLAYAGGAMFAVGVVTALIWEAGLSETVVAALCLLLILALKPRGEMK